MQRAEQALKRSSQQKENKNWKRKNSFAFINIVKLLRKK